MVHIISAPGSSWRQYNYELILTAIPIPTSNSSNSSEDGSQLLFKLAKKSLATSELFDLPASESPEGQLLTASIRACASAVPNICSRWVNASSRVPLHTRNSLLFFGKPSGVNNANRRAKVKRQAVVPGSSSLIMFDELGRELPSDRTRYCK